MREIVFDTETTGLDPLRGDRVVEIGCVELLNHMPTGAVFHVYINPERDMPAEAERVHGLSAAFLADKPKFADIADDFLKFIEGARLVAHNASFDINFLNAELTRIGKPAIDNSLVIDTLVLARRRNPGARNSLDDLCARFGIDNSRRTKHGALLDSEILADVYLELLGGRQATLGLGLEHKDAVTRETRRKASPRPAPLPSRLTPEAIAAHARFVKEMGAGALWRDYLDIDALAQPEVSS